MSSVRTTTHLSGSEFSNASMQPGPDQRWSTWTEITPTQRGPQPHPEWLVTASGAFDTELGIVKSGKEAEVHLIERAVPGTAGCLLAAKRFLGSQHSDFHRSSAYTEGRSIRDTREARAVKRKSSFGRLVAGEQWAFTEFEALVKAWEAGVAVPYPVQVNGTEILMEYIGQGRVAAPRLAQSKRTGKELAEAYDQVVSILESLARMGCVHGDLSPYNLLDDGQRIVVIDLPQVIDAVANPMGLSFLHRDVVNIVTWFNRRGLDVDPESLFAGLVAQMW